MAHGLDKSNRKLKENEQQLRIEFSSQENDSTLLIKQIIYYQRQEKALKAEHGRVKTEVENNRNEEAKTDRQLQTRESAATSRRIQQGRKHRLFVDNFKQKAKNHKSMKSLFSVSVHQKEEEEQSDQRVYTASTLNGRPSTVDTTPNLVKRNKLLRVESMHQFVCEAPVSMRQSMGRRTASHGFLPVSTNWKVQRNEALINRFKRKLEDEQRLLRQVRTMLAEEKESKTMLERLLRSCV